MILIGEVPTTLSLSGMGEPKYPVLASATFPVTIWAGSRALTIYDDYKEITAKVNNLLTIAAVNYARVRSRMAPLTNKEAQEALAVSMPGSSLTTGSGSSRHSARDCDDKEDVERADA